MRQTLLFALIVGLPASTLAGDMAAGDPIKPFRLRTVNPDVTGSSYVGLSNHVGPDAKEPKKAVLLTFFATYCEPCKREMPFLAALDQAYRDKGLLILSITIDKEKEKIDEARLLATEHGVRFPVLSDRFNIVAKRYGIEKLPCVYLVNSQGRITLGKVGYQGEVTHDLHAAIRAALGESATAPIPEALAKYIK